jgi:hypothetical protein
LAATYSRLFYEVILWRKKSKYLGNHSLAN